MGKKTLINLKEIKDLYGYYCEKNKKQFSNKEFKKFLDFLEIDFCDWIRENLKQFDKQ